METTLQEQYNDSLEYVKNIKKLGGDEQMAEYQARQQQNYVHQTIKEYIADLHLEQFATKADLQHAIDCLRFEMKSEISNLRAETTVKLNELKVEMLRWQIGIGLTIMSANFAMLKLMLH